MFFRHGRYTAPMKRLVIGLVIAASAVALEAQQPAPAPTTDPIRTLVGRLDLERYKATIKGLTQFGDRRQGTKRNRDAVDWIEAQLKSYGCANVERITYQFTSPAPRQATTPAPARQAPDPNNVLTEIGRAHV